MKALVIYDSLYGNTEQIAKAMGEALGEGTKVVRVRDIKPADIAPYAFVIIGSPTQGGRPTPALQTFLASLPDAVFVGKRLAAFDTRAKSFITKLFGYAADRIETALKAKRANVTAQPQGFFVKAVKGPLVEGELERAAVWAKAVVAGSQTV